MSARGLVQLAVLVGLASRLPAQEPSWLARMSFALAQKPFRQLAHRLCGYVSEEGRVRHDGLAPASYVSVVLHRMRDGADWLATYRVDVHQWDGARIAAHFALGRAVVLEAECLQGAAPTQAFVQSGVLAAGGLYLFCVEAAGRRHLGFVRVGPEGALMQSHFSGLPHYGALAEGEFRHWYAASPFARAPVQLYRVPEPAIGEEGR